MLRIMPINKHDRKRIIMGNISDKSHLKKEIERKWEDSEIKW